MSGQRIPKKEGFYNDKKEAEVFIKTADNSWLLKYFEKNFIKYILKKYEKLENINVLDLGCGPGFIATSIAKARPDWKITAVDCSLHMIKFAKKNVGRNISNVRWVNAKAEDVNLQQNQFDLIMCHYSFSEFIDAKKVLRNIVNVSKHKAHLEMTDVIRIKSRLFINIITRISRLFYSKNFNIHYINSLKGAYNIKELKDIFSLPEFKKIKFKYLFPNRIACNIYIYIGKDKIRQDITNKLKPV